MARQIRLSKAEAIAAGLLDPAVAGLLKESAGRGSITTSARAISAPSKSSSKVAIDTEADASTAEKPKRRRSVSRPAIHPKISAGPAGDGSYTLGNDGKVMSAELRLDLVPVPKERPRVVKDPVNDRTFGFTPARTKHFTVEVARVVDHVLSGQSPIDGPVQLDMTFVMQVPKTWPKWKREAALQGLVVPTGRPDMDNLEKALLDAFNEKLIVDDAFVVERRARKVYGEMPQIRVRVEKTGQLDINVRREALEGLRHTAPISLKP